MMTTDVVIRTVTGRGDDGATLYNESADQGAPTVDDAIDLACNVMPGTQDIFAGATHVARVHPDGGVDFIA